MLDDPLRLVPHAVLVAAGTVAHVPSIEAFRDVEAERTRLLLQSPVVLATGTFTGLGGHLRRKPEVDFAENRRREAKLLEPRRHILASKVLVDPRVEP